MSKKVQSVLVEYEDKNDDKVYANSGLQFADRYTLITTNILTPLLFKQNNLVRKLKADRLLDPKILLNVVPQINVVGGAAQRYQQGVPIAMFISSSLRRSCEKILSDWTVDHQEAEGQFKDALSLFFILDVGATSFDFDHLTKCLRNIWADQVTASIGQKIIIESSPFGNRNFLSSYSQGIVSNVMGENDCLILSDAPTAPGSEGAPIFLKGSRNETAFGVVISSLSWWKGEWIGLTLGANLSTVIKPLVGKKFCVNPKMSPRIEIGNVVDVMDHSVVQIVSETSWGTAILLDKDSGLFITNSHVIENDEATLYWRQKKIDASVVFKTNPIGAYDLAVIATNKRDLSNTQMKSVPVSLEQLSIGERIFAAGFPLFARELKPKPTLTSGHVSQVDSFMIKTTCSVLPGSSGGAILRSDGALVGIIVSNVKFLDNASSAYPRVNLAVPISAIYGTIQEYLQVGDVSVLQNLQVEDRLVEKQWNLLCCKL